MSVVVSLATRGRPQQFVATLNQHMKMLTRPDTKMIVQVDRDDMGTVMVLGASDLDPRVSVNIKPREDTIAAKWNRALSEPAEVYLKASDDDPFITPDIDEKVLKAASIFPDGIGVVYGRMANASFPSVVAYTAKWAEKLGYLEPEYFPYWFADHWSDDIAKIIGRISFADVTTDQSKVGKTMEMREPGWWATWFDAAYLMRRDLAHKIINDPDFQSPEWQKQILLAHHPLIEHRSRWINDTVRQQSRQLEGWSNLSVKDERYQHTKQAAIAMLPALLENYGMDAREAAAFRELIAPPTQIAAIPRMYG